MTGLGAARLALAMTLVAAGVAAADLPRLPKELPLPKGAESPGQVVFRHDSHVDAAKPACLECHPRRFSILERAGGEARPAITHEVMEKRAQACGACHGQAAFGFDECGNCHAE
jgi:c(7)-type cytochrome triheme protein